PPPVRATANAPRALVARSAAPRIHAAAAASASSAVGVTTTSGPAGSSAMGRLYLRAPAGRHGGAKLAARPPLPIRWGDAHRHLRRLPRGDGVRPRVCELRRAGGS